MTTSGTPRADPIWLLERPRRQPFSRIYEEEEKTHISEATDGSYVLIYRVKADSEHWKQRRIRR
jgi:hypothetical protein